MTKSENDIGTGKSEGYSRRGVLGALGGLGLGAALLAAFPNAASAEIPGSEGQRAIDMADEMAEYSRDPGHKGIGIFINLQSNATLEQGQKLGENMKRAFASRGVPVEYRLNQSQGTATDLTFYVKGIDFTIGLPDLKRELRTVLAHHGDVWPRQTSALSTLDQ